MKISELKGILSEIDTLDIKLPNGQDVPAHFHVTEIGMVIKHFIDCGGKERIERKVSLQLWTAEDVDHRLKPSKLLDIINVGEDKLGISNLEIEVEYQNTTIGKYGLNFEGPHFVLNNLKTDCLAKENCGTPQEKQTVPVSEMIAADGGSCTPGGGCC